MHRLSGLPSPRERSSKDKFLIASDIHFNPMADATLVSTLQAADPGTVGVDSAAHNSRQLQSRTGKTRIGGCCSQR